MCEGAAKNIEEHGNYLVTAGLLYTDVGANAKEHEN